MRTFRTQDDPLTTLISGLMSFGLNTWTDFWVRGSVRCFAMEIPSHSKIFVINWLAGITVGGRFELSGHSTYQHCLSKNLLSFTVLFYSKTFLYTHSIKYPSKKVQFSSTQNHFFRKKNIFVMAKILNSNLRVNERPITRISLSR